MIRPGRADALAAGALALAAAIEAAAVGGDGAEVAAAVAVALPVAWRRVAPTGALAACAVAILGGDVAGMPLDTTLPLASLVLCVYAFAVRADRRRALLVMPALALAVPLGFALGGDEPVFPEALFAVGIFIAGPFVAGRLVRSRTALTERLAERARELEAEREGAAERAATATRGRLAGELHGIVTAGVTAMLADAGEARRLAREDPARAERAVAAVELRGREALADMRALLGVLRRGDEDLALRPQPSLARLEALAAARRTRGCAIELHSEGEPHAVAPGIDVAGFRVVEEALAAVGDRPASVLVRWSPEGVGLEVATDGPELADAAALAGTRERVRLFGGRAQTGRRPLGGSALRAELPAPQVVR